ncbi:MAG: MFS transporter, partial [Gammaproteobacteria bacterium]|nr:MFS transporter [Gammaproteobacteria bacterium]
WGVASAVGGAAPSAYAADTAPPGMNAAAMSTFRMLGDLGYVVGPITLGAVVDLWGAPVALVIAAVLLMAVGVCFAVLAPETYARGRDGAGRE